MAQNIFNLSPNDRAQYAELLRERIYSTITLLALVVVLWQHPSDYTAWGVIGTIIGTVGALWLATLIASRMSYRIIHDGSELESHYRKSSEAASGLLSPAGAPVFFVLISMTGLIELKTALLISVISLVLSLFLFSLVSGSKLASNRIALLLYSLLIMGLGLAVVALKLALK